MATRGDESGSDELTDLDKFEHNLMRHSPGLVQDLVQYDSTLDRPCTSASVAAPLPKGEARLKSLQKILKKSNIPESNPEDSSEAVLVEVKKKEPKTLAARLKHDSFVGPTALLCRCVKEGIKIRVSIRGRMVQRSILKGYLLAFDKHWNLAMQDVEETYYRRKRTRILAKPKNKQGLSQEGDLTYPSQLCYKPVNLRYRSNIEIWTRHLNQLFVKGDEIIIVSLIR